MTAHTPNEPNTLVTVSIELEKPHSGEILRVHLGGANWHTNDLNGPANETDGSRHHPGMLNMRMHMITPADKVGNIRTHQIEPKMPNSPAGSATLHSDKPNGCRNHTDRSSVHTDMHNAQMDALTPVNRTERIRTSQTDLKWQDSPHTHETAMPESTYQWRKVSINNIGTYIPRSMPVEALG